MIDARRPHFARIRRWWRAVVFGVPDPGRRVALLGFYGAIIGLGESVVVLLIVGLATGDAGQDLPLVDGLPSSTWALAGIALAALACLALAHLGSASAATRASGEAQRSVQRLLLNRYLGAKWPDQAATRTGEIQDLMTVKTAVLAFGTQEAAQAATTLISLLVLVAAAIAVSLVAAAGLLAAAVLVVLIGRPFRARRRRIARAGAAAASDLAVEITEAASTARDFRAFGVVDAARERLSGRIEASARLTESMRFAVTATGPLTRDATLLVLIPVLALIVSGGGPALPELGASVVLILRALSHAQIVSGLAHRLDERVANLEAVEVRLAGWRPAVTSGTRPCPPVDRIELRAVSFRYVTEAPPAVSDLSLEIASGEQLGVVGRTGAGKSTLVALLLGLIAPQEGSIEVNGVPLAEIAPDEWHRRTALVGQEPQLLSGTVAENIRFLRADVDDDAVERSALAAGLGSELEQWPRGLEHDVGPAGAGVSGGQRQRIALARALASSPQLLVLDEPTSALDAHSEAAIRTTLDSLRGRAIVVVIAHRLTTIHACDRVAVIERGRLLRVAPADELAASEPYFREALELASPKGR